LLSKGCGGFVNALIGVNTQITNPHWYSWPPGDEPETSKYPDQCFWFIEARHGSEAYLSLINERKFQNPIIVSIHRTITHYTFDDDK